MRWSACVVILLWKSAGVNSMMTPTMRFVDALTVSADPACDLDHLCRARLFAALVLATFGFDERWFFRGGFGRARFAISCISLDLIRRTVSEFDPKRPA